MKSLIGLPNTHWAGDSFVFGSGVLRYWRMARCRKFVSRLLFGSVLSVMSRFHDNFSSTALQHVPCDRQLQKAYWRVAAAVNSGPPAVAHSSGMPNVANARWRQPMRPLDPSCARSMVGHFSSDPRQRGS